MYGVVLQWPLLFLKPTSMPTFQGLTDHIAVQSMVSGGGQWGADGKDKSDSAPHTWNMEIFVQVLKDVVSSLESLQSG